MTGENVLLLRSQDSKVVDVVPTKDFSNFKVDASLSFDARKTSQQNDVPKTEEEDNVIDVDVGVTKPSSVTKDDTDITKSTGQSAVEYDSHSIKLFN